MKARKSVQQVEGTVTVEPRGGFAHDGRWIEDMPRHPKGQTHQFVDTLVKERRSGGLTLARAAFAIDAGHQQHAFPNYEQWRTATSWAHARCSTSAEQAVVHAGRGPDGHWCGELYEAGSERDCPDTRHRALPQASEVAGLMSVVMASLPNVPRETWAPQEGLMLRADEDYFRRRAARAQRPGQ